MSMLAIPENGLQLESSPKSSNFLPLQAFGLALDDDVIEDMIKCVQNGDQIELALGSNPSFHYGSKVQKFIPDDFQYDLYLTTLDESTTKAQRLPNPTTSLFKKPTTLPNKPSKSQTERAMKGNKQSGRALSSGPESDKSVSGTKSVNGVSKSKGKSGKAVGLLPPGKSAMATALSSNTPRSLPPSPSLNSAPSPNPAISASQQLLEKNKEQRTILVHELAAQDQTYEHLQDCWMGADSDMKPTLEKIASYDAPSQKWTLKKLYWKELDVWNYDYDSQADRQSAIDNAIKNYDKQRIGTTSPEWERLLHPEERGKGVVLSKLQVNLAKGNITPTPKISVQKTEDGGKSDADSSKPKSTPMSRSGSQSGVTKTTKKSTDTAKRLLSTNPKKPAPAKKPLSRAKAPDDKDKRGPLSEEFVVDSDSSGDEPPPPNPPPVVKQRTIEKPVKKPAEEPVEKPVQKRKESPAPAPAPKPKPVVRAPRAPIKAPVSSTTKRARDDDDSSSSSGTPLAKRIKPKEALKPRPKPPAAKHRTSDVSQTSRSTVTATQSSNFSMKSKNTSPVKSSPLASSPPTNASDLEDQGQGRTQTQTQTQKRQQPLQRNGERTNGLSNGNSVSTTKKRKERDVELHVELQVPNKKPRVSKEILKRANLFTHCYKRYEALHKEIVALKEPPEDKLADLLDMRERLVEMKSEISREVAASA